MRRILLASASIVAFAGAAAAQEETTTGIIFSGDAELGEPDETLRSGTGRMWVGTKERSDGWRGGWWIRFKAWWHRIFY